MRLCLLENLDLNWRKTICGLGALLIAIVVVFFFFRNNRTAPNRTAQRNLPTILDGTEKRSAKTLEGLTVLDLLNFPRWIVGAINWHQKSMEQYYALQPRPWEEVDHGVCVVDYDITVKRNVETGLLEPNDDMFADWLGFKGFLCDIIDPAYICDAALVWSFDGDPNSMAHVQKLKNVEQIVLLNDPDERTMKHWREQFPDARVYTGKELGYRNPKDGGVF